MTPSQIKERRHTPHPHKGKEIGAYFKKNHSFIHPSMTPQPLIEPWPPIQVRIPIHIQ
jgi:hypothetical protein